MLNLRGLAQSPSTETVHGDGLEILGEFGGLVLAGAELVVIVVGGNVFIAVFLFRRAEGALGEGGSLVPAKAREEGESSSRPARNAAGNPARNLRRLR